MAEYRQKNFLPIDASLSDEERELRERLNTSREASIILSTKQDTPDEINVIEADDEIDKNITSNKTGDKEPDPIVLDDHTKNRLAKRRDDDSKAVEAEKGKPKTAEAESNKLEDEVSERIIKSRDLNDKGDRIEDENQLALNVGKDPDFDAEKRTEDALKHQVLLMGQVHKQFKVEGAEYHFKDGQKDLAFKDKGARMVTSTNDVRAAKAMATMAKAKGWSSLKLSGHKDFKREVWLEASSQGLNVRGYTPTEQDLKDLTTKKEQQMTNKVEQDTIKAKSVEPDKGSDKLQVVAAVAKSYVAAKVPEGQKQEVQEAITKRLADKEQQGTLPTVPMYDKNAPLEPTTEKARPVVEREAEHNR